MASTRRDKRPNLSRLLLRHWAWIIVGGLLISSGLTGYRIYQMGLPEGIHLFVNIATNLVIIALVLSIRYVVIEGLVRGIRKGMEQSSQESKAEKVASDIGRTAGLYVGQASRSLSRGLRRAYRVTRAGAQVVRQTLEDRNSSAQNKA